ncbi:MAG: phosphate ABC transporter substrate-binding protein [Coriobacteriia bacterium]|nr:phosphate ABC transporter substrate-binding protein [Coriobacteriia bacterium]
MKTFQRKSRSKTAAVLLAVALLLASVFLVAACSADTAEDTAPAASDTDDVALSGMLTIEGSDTMVNLAQAWAEQFMDENPEVMLTIRGGGSGAGIASLINGTVDFALASRDVKEDEFAEGAAVGVDIVENTVANDGIGVIVNPAVGITDISTDDLGKIYRGEISDWSQLGGTPGSIVLLGRDTASGTYEFFLEAVVGKDNEYAQTMRNLQSNQAIVDEVRNNPAAIGYVGMGYIVDDVTVLAIDGVAATAEAVNDGSYGLARKLLMNSDGTPTGLAKAFLDWVQGAQGQSIVVDEGFVPIN